MVTLFSWFGVGAAQAGMVVYEDVGFMSTQNTSPERFSIATAGTYQVKLVDFSFPESFKSLELLIISASPAGLHEVARLDSAGEAVFDATAGIYYAALFGEVNSALGLGLYGVQISEFSLTDTAPAPVPLPPALWLLGSVLMSLAAFYRQPQTAVAETA